MEIFSVVINKESKPGNPLIRLLFLGNPITDRRVKNFISLFLDLGYKVEFVFATPGANGREQGTAMSIEGVTVKQLFLQYSGGVKMFLEYDRLLAGELDDSGPCDVVMACELYSLRASSIAKIQGKAKRLIYDARELYTELPTVAGSPLKKWFWKRRERKGLLQTDLVLVTAPDDAPAIEKVHGFLPPDILVRNLPRSEELRPNNYLRDLFSISPEKKIFVYLGGLQQDRGLAKMVNVISLIQSAVLIMIGEGAMKEELQKTIDRSNLHQSAFIHPVIESEKAIGILASADIGVNLIEQNSKSYELALPSKVFEYILAGLPVLSSHLKQVKDLFDGSEGFVFANPDDPVELLDSCKKALKLSGDPKLRNRIHEQAQSNLTFETDTILLKAFLSRTP